MGFFDKLFGYKPLEKKEETVERVASPEKVAHRKERKRLATIIDMKEPTDTFAELEDKN